MDELYRQEVLELTELLRHDEDWEDLRDVLAENGFNLAEILLVSFMEDDYENEYGVIVTKDIKISEYSRFTGNLDNNAQDFKVKDITNQVDEIANYPQVPIAIDMIRSGEILF